MIGLGILGVAGGLVRLAPRLKTLAIVAYFGTSGGF